MTERRPAHDAEWPSFWHPQIAIELSGTGFRRSLRDIAPDITDRQRWAELNPELTSRLLADVESDLTNSRVTISASDWSRFMRSGNRAEYESKLFAMQDRLSRLVVATAYTDDDRLVAAAVDVIIVLCELSSWCWPAHDEGWSKLGLVSPDVRNPTLDLGASEVAAQLGWADHILGPKLAADFPGVRERVRFEVERRVFRPFLTRRDWHWLGHRSAVNNWSAWVNSNVIAAALCLVDDPSERVRLVDLGVGGLEQFAASLPSDGAIDEGFTYWWQGAGRLLDGLELLERVAGRQSDLYASPRLTSLVSFPRKMHLSGPWYVNFADGSAKPAGLPWRTLFHWASATNDVQSVSFAVEQASKRASHLNERLGLWRCLAELFDRDISLARVRDPRSETTVWMPSKQVWLARESVAADVGLTVAVKGGHNMENHNHLDVGSFIAASDGVPVIIDLGAPTYTSATFGPDRYSIWAMRSESHNVPQPFGRGQGIGEKFAAHDVQVAEGDSASSISLDIARAYAVEELQRWTRRVGLDRSAKEILIADDWECSPATDLTAPPHVLRLMIAADVPPSLHGNRLEVVPLEVATPIRITWDAAVAHAALEEHAVRDSTLAQVWGPVLWSLSLTIARSANRVGSSEIRIRQVRV